MEIRYTFETNKSDDSCPIYRLMGLQGELTHFVGHASADNLLVGAVFVVSDSASNTILSYLYVLPEYRKMGIADALMFEVIKRYGGVSHLTAVLSDELRPFFEKYGFKLSSDERRMYYSV